MPNPEGYVEPEYVKPQKEYHALYVEVSNSIFCLDKRWMHFQYGIFLNKECNKLLDERLSVNRNLDYARKLLSEVARDIYRGPFEELSTRYRIAIKQLESFDTVLEQSKQMIDRFVLSFYLTRDLGDRWNRLLLGIEGAAEVAEKIDTKHLTEEERLEKTSKKLLFYANVYSQRADFKIANALLETANDYNAKRWNC